jgi:hypothetical protein
LKISEDSNTSNSKPHKLTLNRIAYISKLSTIIEYIKERSIPLIPDLLDFVKEEGPTFVLAALGQIVPVSDYLYKNCAEEGYSLLIKSICPFLQEHIFSNEADVRTLSRSRLGDIAPLLTEDDRNYQVLPVCLNLVHDENENENKVAGLKLLG